MRGVRMLNRQSIFSYRFTCFGKPILVVLLLVFCGSSSVAEIITYRITGTVSIVDYYNNLLIARKKLLKGLITPTGNLLTLIQYKWISGVEYGLLRVIIEEKTDDTVIKRWGLIDTQGNEILPAIYDNISPVRSNGSLVYAVKDNKTIKFDISNLTQRTNIK